MARLFALVFLLQIALAAAALISCLSAETGEIRRLPRFGWLLVIIFLPVIGSIAWFVGGKARRERRQTGPWSGNGATGGRASRAAPDDDPDFLRSLDAEQAKKDRELFEEWEKDLRRREDELHNGDNDKAPHDET